MKDIDNIIIIFSVFFIVDLFFIQVSILIPESVYTYYVNVNTFIHKYNPKIVLINIVGSV